MSFRHTFVTDFIYSGVEEYKDANAKLAEIFRQWCHRTLDKELDERGFGYFAGVIGSGHPDLDLSDMGLGGLVYELEKVTPVPFRLTVMQESGPVITYAVEPRK